MLSALAAIHAQGQPALAETLLRDALTVLSDGIEPKEYVYELQAQLGLALIRQERNREAESVLVAAYEGLRRSAGRTARSTREALRDLATCYERMSQIGRLMEIASLRLSDLLSPPLAPASELASASWQAAANQGLPAETYALAQRAAERAVELNPTAANFHYVLAACQYRRGDFSLALTTLMEASRLPSNLHGADWAFTAMAHAQLGHDAAADAALQPLRKKVASAGERLLLTDRKLLREAEETLSHCLRHRPPGSEAK